MAHAKKRRFIQTRDEYMRAALLCRACHNDLEFNGHERMDATIGKLIEARDLTFHRYFSDEIEEAYERKQVFIETQDYRKS